MVFHRGPSQPRHVKDRLSPSFWVLPDCISSIDLERFRKNKFAHSATWKAGTVNGHGNEASKTAFKFGDTGVVEQLVRPKHNILLGLSPLITFLKT